MAFFFASPIDIDVKLEGEELRKQVDMKSDKDRTVSCPVYYDGDSVAGQVCSVSCRVVTSKMITPLQVTLRVREGTRHEGIKVEFVGSIGGHARNFRCYVNSHRRLIPELFYDRGHHHEFLSLSQELAAPGELHQVQTFDFLFKNVEKQFESYQGINVKLRCVITWSCTCQLTFWKVISYEYRLQDE